VEDVVGLPSERVSSMSYRRPKNPILPVLVMLIVVGILFGSLIVSAASHPSGILLPSPPSGPGESVSIR